MRKLIKGKVDERKANQSLRERGMGKERSISDTVLSVRKVRKRRPSPVGCCVSGRQAEGQDILMRRLSKGKVGKGRNFSKLAKAPDRSRL